ncbi:MAG: acylneuraminate cytidylyltransferase family protein [Phycisphaerales bacterium]|nr:acylneuraminate cytidylyltransferase family protein [Phycisphaerales bacterium]
MTTVLEKPLAIVPARGGSKRFPRKNVALLGGKPLIAWTVEAAVASGVFDQVWVSSDDAEICAAGEAAGGVSLARPAELAADNATVAQVCTAVARDFAARNQPYHAVYVLLPTSPLRKAASIRAAWDVYCSREADALVSVSPLAHPPEWALTIANGWVKPMDAAGYDTPRPQLVPKYRADGAHTIVSLKHLLATGSLIGPRTASIITPAGEAVDVDTPEDLAWAEFLLSRQG